MLAVYDPAAAEQRANAASHSANAGAPVPFLAPPPVIIDAVPLSAAAPSKAAGEPAEPWWLREHLFPRLRLRFDLPVHFIAEKPVTATDLDSRQSRFRLPIPDVMRNLCPILSDEELEAASIPREETPAPRPPPTEEELQGRRKRMGKKHGGLPVLVVNLDAGIQELQLTRWESSGVIVIKGEGYSQYITQCSFKAEDDEVVQIWAFRDRTFHYFGVDLCQETPLFVLLTKKERQPAA
ncbi:hypothetical protein BRADI_2g46390v3 [Brachypodium distachyon]|uniref:TF-B3 domain-containing protein n=1 Tax=Brachypodium distachyon TaxID=15368 RepID=A0A2K2DE74_BRADI|nr:hypothetical protein BRADI_2g46390v3 [Brachypodium distachyon]